MAKPESRRRPCLLQVEELDARIVPTVTVGPIAGLVPSNTVSELFGLGQGTYSRPLVKSSAGIDYTLAGAADFAGLGEFSLNGSVFSVGKVLEGHAVGALTFANGSGSLTVDLIGPTQGAFASLPQLFSEQIVSATGAYQVMVGKKDILQLDIWTSSDISGGTAQGTFTLIAGVTRAVPPLRGTGLGDYTEQLSPNGGPQFDLAGSASLAALGGVTVAGSVSPVGLVTRGHATGTLTLSNANGSVTIDLEGPVQPAFSPLPRVFHYQVVSGTGDYLGLAAEGTLSLKLTAARGSLNGTFALAISPV